MPANYSGKYTNYKDDRGKYVGVSKKPGFAKGELNPKAPASPAEAKRDIVYCGARRTGKSSSGAGICCMPAGWGTEHIGTGRCKYHGGNTPSHNMQALRNEAVLVAKRIYGEDVDIDPHEALLGEVRRTVGAVVWLQEHIRELEDPEKLKQLTNNMGIQPSVWIQMYQQERQHLVRVSKACIDAGIAERSVRIAEGQGRQIAMVLTNFLQDPELGLSNVQLAKAPHLIRKHLLAIEGAATIKTTSGKELTTTASVETVDAEVIATAPNQAKAGGRIEAGRKKAAAARKGKASGTTAKEK